MWAWLRPATVRGKLVMMALVTTFVALMTAAAGMLLYDLNSCQQYWVDDMTTQAEIVAVVSTPAHSFNDPGAARQNIGLPRVNGDDLARGLRKLPGLRNTVLVAVTGCGQQKDRMLALDAGFTAHRVKPVAVDQILAILGGSREGLLRQPLAGGRHEMV